MGWPSLSTIKGCIRHVGWCHFCWCLKRVPKQTEPARPCLPCFVHPNVQRCWHLTLNWSHHFSKSLKTFKTKSCVHFMTTSIHLLLRDTLGELLSTSRIRKSGCTQNYHERSTKPHNTHPLSVICWDTVYFGLEGLILPFVFLYDLGAQAAYRDTFFFTACLWGGQLATLMMWSFMFRPRIADTTFKVTEGGHGDKEHKTRGGHFTGKREMCAPADFRMWGQRDSVTTGLCPAARTLCDIISHLWLQRTWQETQTSTRCREWVQ